MIEEANEIMNNKVEENGDVKAPTMVIVTSEAAHLHHMDRDVVDIAVVAEAVVEEAVTNEVDIMDVHNTHIRKIMNPNVVIRKAHQNPNLNSLEMKLGGNEHTYRKKSSSLVVALTDLEMICRQKMILEVLALYFWAT